MKYDRSLEVIKSKNYTRFFQYYIIYLSKLSNLRSCSENNVIIYYQNYIMIYGFANHFKNKVRKSLVDTT